MKKNYIAPIAIDEDIYLQDTILESTERTFGDTGTITDDGSTDWIW